MQDLAPFYTLSCAFSKAIILDNISGFFLATTVTKLNSVAFSPQANYTDRATAAFRRSQCQLLLIKGVAWSAQRIPTTVNIGFLDWDSSDYEQNYLPECDVAQSSINESAFRRNVLPICRRVKPGKQTCK
jgi:hypothetical protein